MTPLYGHVSEDTAYLVEDYPYGRDRCRIKFWIESHDKKGFRLCSRTEHPRTQKWNAIKKSTYYRIAANLYLDAEQHVKCQGLSEYSSAEECWQYLQNFPENPPISLRLWVKLKVKHHQRQLETNLVGLTLKGETLKLTVTDRERVSRDLRFYQQCLDQLGLTG